MDPFVFKQVISISCNICYSELDISLEITEAVQAALVDQVEYIKVCNMYFIWKYFSYYICNII